MRVLSKQIVPVVTSLPGSGVAGQIVFNSTTNLYYGWNPGSSSWVQFGGITSRGYDFMASE